MKPFDDFWNTLTADDFNELIDYVNNSSDEIKNELLSKNTIGTEVLMTSLLTTRFMLAKYHQWISEES